MTTGSSDYYIKQVTPVGDTTTLYYYKSGKPVIVPSSEVASKLQIKKQPLIMEDNGEVSGYEKEYNLFVRTKEECIDSVVSGTTNQVALDGNAKRNKRKRGRRGKRNR